MGCGGVAGREFWFSFLSVIWDRDGHEKSKLALIPDTISLSLLGKDG